MRTPTPTRIPLTRIPLSRIPLIRIILTTLIVASILLAVGPQTPAEAATPTGLTYVPCRPNDVAATTAAATPAEQQAITNAGRVWTVRTNAQLSTLVNVDLKNYWGQATLGRLTDIRLAAWVTVDENTSTFLARGSQGIWNACKAKASGLPAGHGIVVMLPSPWCAQGNVGWACVATGHDPADIAHESGHALGLSHSWGQAPDVSTATEYSDKFDVLGNTAGGNYQYRDGAGARWGPGLAAPQLNILGYVPSTRVASYGSITPGQPARIGLRSLSRQQMGGYLMASVATGLGRNLTVEYRMKEGPDAGFPGNRVVVHQVDSRVTYRADLVQGGTVDVDGMIVRWRSSTSDVTAVNVEIEPAAPQIVYGLTSGGDLMCYQHNGYLSGSGSWSYGNNVGWGWNQVFAGSGSVYGIESNGDLMWYRHDSSSTCGQAWTGRVKVGNGWNFKQVFGMTSTESDGGGVIYAIGTDGVLHWYRHYCYANGGSTGGCWASNGGTVVGTGWQGFRQVFSGGNGVIYGIQQDGTLLWYRHKAYKTGGGLAGDWEGPYRVGTGWQSFTNVFAGGSDGVIYAVQSDGSLRWYRHLAVSTGGGAVTDWTGPNTVGSGWNSFRTAFIRNVAPPPAGGGVR